MTCSLDSVRLFRFMRLFGITMIDIRDESGCCINAKVGWEDGENQDIRWIVQKDSEIDLALTLGEFVYDNGLLNNDKINTSKDELKKKLNWDNDKFEFALKALLSLKVDMIDNGQPTDGFFIHL